MEKGYYKKVEKVVHHEAVAGIEEQYHYETKAIYANGGKDVVKVIDVEGKPAKEAYDEVVYEDVFVEYTEKEKAELRIKELKQLLVDTDYKAIKFAEGALTAEEYNPVKINRQNWRVEINALERTFNL